jgi:hypothetical protein
MSGLQSLLLQPSTTPSSRPLIQVLRDDSIGIDVAKKSRPDGTLFDSKSLDDDEEDDEENDGPPPIFQSVSSDTTKVIKSADNDYAAEPPTLAEQLLAEATLAKEMQQRHRTQQERKNATKATFGMKKGFLNSSSSSTKQKANNNKKAGGEQRISKVLSKTNKGNAAAPSANQTSQVNLIHELDDEGNMIPSASTNNSLSNTINSNNYNNNPLHLPEVQSAMKLPPSSQWATPDLLDTITRSHPNLVHGLNDPRYTAALHDMQTKPKETLEVLQKTNPEIVNWLMEFCGVLGQHFSQLGEEMDGKQANGGGDGTNDGNKTKDLGSKVREMGLLERRALEKHRQMQAVTNDEPTHRRASGQDDAVASSPPTSKEMDDQVSAILANEELRSILMDPVMQNIMDECSTGNKFRYYLAHDEFGPKLRLLLEAGLIQMA